jgi:hypothetical protein
MAQEESEFKMLETKVKAWRSILNDSYSKDSGAFGYPSLLRFFHKKRIEDVLVVIGEIDQIKFGNKDYIERFKVIELLKENPEVIFKVKKAKLEESLMPVFQKCLDDAIAVAKKYHLPQLL